ncbi:MAG: AI-2E family transporter [Chloroflexota bacterium]|nr:MAG: AI-2E family transporter [Chloroflexota bacterium]
MSQKSLSFTLRFILGVAGLGIALIAVRQASGIIVPLLLAWIVVLSASPLFFWLREKNAPGWLAFILTFLAILAVGAFLVITLIVAVDRLFDLLPTYADEIDSIKQSIADFLASLGLGQANSVPVADLIDPGALMDLYAGLLGGLVETLSNVVLIFMAIIFMLVEAFNMPRKVAAELDAGNDYVRRLSDFSLDIRRYISITTWIGLLTGALDTIFFMIMGVPLPLLWGILAFLLSYIPVIGFWLAAIPPTILAWLESGPLAAIIVFVGIILINGFADEVLKPKFMGEGLDLAPIMVILSITIWTAVLGPMGAILGIPVTMIVKELVLEADEKNAWIARLISKGDEKPAPGEPEETSSPA